MNLETKQQIINRFRALHEADASEEKPSAFAIVDEPIPADATVVPVGAIWFEASDGEFSWAFTDALSEDIELADLLRYNVPILTGEESETGVEYIGISYLINKLSEEIAAAR